MLEYLAGSTGRQVHRLPLGTNLSISGLSQHNRHEILHEVRVVCCPGPYLTAGTAMRGIRAHLTTLQEEFVSTVDSLTRHTIELQGWCMHADSSRRTSYHLCGVSRTTTLDAAASLKAPTSDACNRYSGGFHFIHRRHAYVAGPPEDRSHRTKMQSLICPHIKGVGTGVRLKPQGCIAPPPPR